MKAASIAFCLSLLATVCSAADQHYPDVSEGIAAKRHVPAKKNVPFVDNGLYLLTLQCNLPKFNPNERYIVQKKVLLFTLTLSNQPVSTNQVPPTSSVLAAIPVAAETISNQPPAIFINHTCNQSFLVTGRTPLYLTILYSNETQFALPPVINAMDDIAGAILPLAVFFPAGPANVLKQDATATTQASGPFGKMLADLNYTIPWTETLGPLQEGYYLIQTPTGETGSVDIAVERLQSIQPTLANRKYKPLSDAWQGSLRTFASQISSDIATKPTQCFTLGQTLEFTQNLSHADAVRTLAQIVVLSAISSVDASNCLGTAYGPEVRDDPWFKNNSALHLANFPNIQNAVPFSLRTYKEIAAAMNAYVAPPTSATAPGAGPLPGAAPGPAPAPAPSVAVAVNKPDFTKWFISPITLTDTTNLVGPSPNMSITQVLDKLKSVQAVYSGYGCAEKDTTFPGDDGAMDTGFILAISKDRNPDNALILRTWWKYDAQKNADKAHIYAMDIGGSDPAIQQALKDYGNECSLGIKVQAPPAAHAN